MDNTIKNTELNLYRFYAKEKSIRALKENISFINGQILKIESEIKECNFTIEPQSTSPSFEAKVQTSNDGTSYAEKEMIRLIDLKLRRNSYLMLEREKILAEIDNIELNAKNIAWRVEDFTGELKELLEHKYKDRWGENKISLEMNISQSQVNKRKQQILEKVAMWDRWNKRGIILE